MELLDHYRPYNFSSTRCFITNLVVDDPIKKIEERIPSEAKRLKGVFLSCRTVSESKLIGVVNLNFNDGALKCYNLPLINTNLVDLQNTSPVPFDEEIKPYSHMTGHYRDFGYGALGPGLEIFIKIYLHYTT